MVADMQCSSTSGGGSSEPDNFMEIWAHNLDEGFDKIRHIVQKYPYVAMVSYITLLCSNTSQLLHFNWKCSRTQNFRVWWLSLLVNSGVHQITSTNCSSVM